MALPAVDQNDKIKMKLTHRHTHTSWLAGNTHIVVPGPKLHLHLCRRKWYVNITRAQRNDKKALIHTTNMAQNEPLFYNSTENIIIKKESIKQ